MVDERGIDGEASQPGSIDGRLFARWGATYKTSFRWTVCKNDLASRCRCRCVSVWCYEESTSDWTGKVSRGR